MTKQKKINRKPFITAKLILFDWGWRDNILYSSVAKSNEKSKGLAMVERLKNLFNINHHDEKQFREKMIEMHTKAFTPTEYSKGKEPIRWTRNERGQIISPFDKKIKKEVKDGRGTSD